LKKFSVAKLLYLLIKLPVKYLAVTPNDENAITSNTNKVSLFFSI